MGWRVVGGLFSLPTRFPPGPARRKAGLRAVWPPIFVPAGNTKRFNGIPAPRSGTAATKRTADALVREFLKGQIETIQG